MSSPSANERDRVPQPEDAGDAAAAIRLWEQTYSESDLKSQPGLTYKPPAPAAGKQERPPGFAATLPLPGLTQAPALPALSQGGRDFTLREKIGEGGMGVVWSAEQASLCREVAVKHLKPHGHAPQQMAVLEELFVSESLVTAFLDHPNIAPVHAMGRDEQGRLFLAMKRVQGTSWRALLHPSTPAEEAKAKGYDREAHLRLLLSVCNAVAFAHSKGFIHRDLKPENVMVGDYGEAWVMDWGLAADVREYPTPPFRAWHAVTVATPAGSPAYMAPEMALGRGAELGPWTDVYLLGAILHEVLTGWPPHHADTAREAIAYAARGRPPTFGPDVPQELALICRKALARDPTLRHRSAELFRRELDGYLKHQESVLLFEKASEESRLLARHEAARGLTPQEAYGRHAQIVAYLQQALDLWPQNNAARLGLRGARLAYAETALRAGELALAQAQVEGLGQEDAVRDELEARIQRESLERQWREVAARRARWGLIAAVALIIIGLTVGFFWIRAARDSAVLAQEMERKAKDAALAARDAEVKAKQSAESRRQEAEQSRIAAIAARDAERSAKETAEARRQEAEKARNEALAAKDAEAKARQAETKAREAELASTKKAEASARELSVQAALSLIAQSDTLAVGGRGQEAKALALDAQAKLQALGEPILVSQVAVDGAQAGIPPLRPFFNWSCSLQSIRFSPDRRWVLDTARGDPKTVQLWDVATGKAVRVFKGNAGSVYGLNFAPNGRWILAASEDKTTRIWDTQTGREVQSFRGYPDSIGCVVASPDCRTVVTVGGSTNDRTLRLWDVGTGREIHTIQRTYPHGPGGGAENSVSFSPDGRWLASGDPDGKARVWDVATQAELGAFQANARDDPKFQSLQVCVAFSPDGRLLVTGSGGECIVRVWDLLARREVHSFRGHTNLVMSAIFAPDTKSVLSVAADRTVRLWEMETGIETRRVECHNFATMAAFTPDGESVMFAIPGENTIRWFSRGGNEEHLPLLRRVKAARAVLQADPNNADALKTLGGWCVFRGLWQWGVELLGRARRGGATIDRIELARCYWQQDKYAEASREFQAELDAVKARPIPDDPKARQQREWDILYFELCLDALKRSLAGQPDTNSAP